MQGLHISDHAKRQEKRIEVNEMRMLRRMCIVTRKDKNEHNETDADIQKDHAETIELFQACGEDR